jgi:uncharacterized protein
LEFDAVSQKFLEMASLGVRDAQGANRGGGLWQCFAGQCSSDRFTQSEIAFVVARDYFYIAAVTETGWPYVRHNSGPCGFLKVLDDKTLGFADFCGNNRGMPSDVMAEGQVALILIDYSSRRRLKILARAERRGLAAEPALAARLALPGFEGKAKEAFLFHVESLDWNNPWHTDPHFTSTEIEAAVADLRSRLSRCKA